MLNINLLSDENLNINFEKEWKKTLIGYLSNKMFKNKIKPSESWKNQLIRIKQKELKNN